MDTKLSAYRGCLLGLAVGDAMGYAVDAKNWEEISRDYGPNGLLGYDLANGCAEVTSYTQLAAFAANGLLLSATRGQQNAHSRFLSLAIREWAKCQQYRGSKPERTACWVAQLPAMRRRMCMDTRLLDALSRETLGTPDAPVNSSASPGALTAAAAAALFFDIRWMEPYQIGILGAEAVALTCGAPEAFLSGAVLAYSIAGIIQEPEQPLSYHFTQAAAAVRGQFGEKFPQAAELAQKVEQAIALTRDIEISPLVAMTILGCTDAPECLAGAVYTSLLYSENFDEAMIAAVNHSGRSAAVGALTGAILGAKLGIEALPEFYLESLECARHLDELAADLAQGRQITRIFDDSWDQKYVQGLPVT